MLLLDKVDRINKNYEAADKHNLQLFANEPTVRTGAANKLFDKLDIGESFGKFVYIINCKYL